MQQTASEERGSAGTLAPMGVGTPSTSTILVHYPAGRGRVVLRTDADGDAALEPEAISADGCRSTFRFHLDKPYRYVRPVLRAGANLHPAKGNDVLVLAGHTGPVDVYPHFLDDHGCTACELHDLVDAGIQRRHQYRVFLPEGYAENPLRRYPVLYMQDGQNLFFADAAPSGHHWRVAETLTRLTAMGALGPVIVVGVVAGDRVHDYTAPGYGAFGRSIVERLKPTIDDDFRTLRGPHHTGVMGSSLGGVVSLYLAWEYPEIFGMAACMSSTFGWRDDLRGRIAAEPKRDLRLYLDSGWPQDNYEVTRDMRAALLGRGFREGLDLQYLVFPQDQHDERSWAQRAHIPFQFFFGRDGGSSSVVGRLGGAAHASFGADYYLG